jgi:hypothetical protein
MTTGIFCFYLQNRLVQTSQTGGQQYSDTSPLVFPGSTLSSLSSLIYYLRVRLEPTRVEHLSHFPLEVILLALFANIRPDEIRLASK